MVDETVTITEAGHKTQQMKAFFNIKAAEKNLQFIIHKSHTMIVHKSKHINEVSELKVDILKQNHDEKNIFHETYDNEQPLKDTFHTKYLGCIMCKYGSNSNNVKFKVHKGKGTRNVTKTSIKGLGKYTIESGIIYFKSLLRGIVLYAAEAMVNLKEKRYKAH